MSNAEPFYIYRPTKPSGAVNVSEDALPWVYDQDPQSGFCARMRVVPADALEAADKRIAELEDGRDNFHMEYRMKCDEETKQLERKLSVAREALESFDGLFDYTGSAEKRRKAALAQIGGDDAS